MQFPHEKKDINLRVVLIHLLCCIAFLMLPFVFSPHTSLHYFFNFDPLKVKNLITSFLLILFFYANYYVFFPDFFIKKRYGLWVLLLISSLMLIFIVPHLLFDKFDLIHFPHNNFDANSTFQPPPPQERPEPESIFHGVFFEETVVKFLFVLAFSILLKTNKLWKESREEKKKAELAFLKSQVNPHFLFNTLNGIYSLSLQNDKNTPEAIIKLSEQMRYVVNEIEKEYVLLEDEIAFLQSYIDLQNLRLGDTVKILFDANDVNGKLKISPLLLIFFVENAFKYGVSTKKKSTIDILIKTEGETFFFRVKNQKNNNKTDFTLQKGLKNVMRRLELIYPTKHTLKIEDKENEYQIELEIKIFYD